jgi:uncharacterized protein (DUF433 family)
VTTRRSTIADKRFERGLYTVPQAARLVGMNASTLATWVHGYERTPVGRPIVKQGPVITAVQTATDNRVIPFIGLVEATVVQAFRRTRLPMQRIRKALQILADQGELHHALASRQLYTDGAAVLYDYSRRHPDDPIKLLTVVASGQRVFHEVILDYLTRITFDHDPWATELIVPVTQHPLLRVRPGVAAGEPLFIVGGAPLSVVRSRYVAGEPVESIAADYDVPREHIIEALGAVWPSAA